MASLSEREIVDYALITGEHKWLTEKVPQFIKKGWQPFGGAAYTISRDGDQSYAQAMVKYAEGSDAGEASSPEGEPL